MKRISILLTLLFLGYSFGKAQDLNMSSSSAPDADTYKSYQNKVTKSNKTISDPVKQLLAKTWFERAKLFQEISDLNTQYLFSGISKIQVKLLFKDPKETKAIDDTKEQDIYPFVTINFEKNAKGVPVVKSWEETQTIFTGTLDTAYNDYLKTISLDTEGKLNKKLTEQLKALTPILQKDALNSYMLNNKKDAFHYFKLMVDIDELKQVNVIDTSIIYYTGVTASEAGLKDQALIYFQKAKKYNYKDAKLFVDIKDAYVSLGDSVNALAALKEGIEKFPDNSGILIELINYYLTKGDSKDAFSYLEKAKNNDPTNKTFFYVEGILYDKMGNPDSAILSYKHAISLDSVYYNAYFNMAVVYYNVAVKKMEEANNEKDDSKYAAKKKMADDAFMEVIPIMEKAHQISPKDKDPMDTLKKLYFRLHMQDKYEKINEELKAIE